MAGIDLETTIAGIQAGDPRAIAQGISAIEDESVIADRFFSSLSSNPSGVRIGVTGAPGVGKSSLLARVVPSLLQRGEKVGVLAIDPTSPFSGGALLADRVRMPADLGPEAFFRSVASRNGSGGVAACTDAASELLIRAGFSLVLIETVGTGQLEMEIAEESDDVWLLLSPESGDGMQLLKSGILEVVHQIVIHKSDREGAQRLSRLAEDLCRDQELPPPLLVSSTEETGIEDLVDRLVGRVEEIRNTPDASGERRRLLRRLRRAAQRRWISQGLDRAGGEASLEGFVQEILSQQTTIEEALDRLAPPGA